MRSRSDHRVAGGPGARRVSDADPSGGIANLGVALTEHDRIAGTVRNVLRALGINFHENSPSIRSACGIRSIVRSAVAHVVADARLECAPITGTGPQSGAEVASGIHIAV